jgi:hypothetical protein
MMAGTAPSGRTLKTQHKIEEKRERSGNIGESENG